MVCCVKDRIDRIGRKRSPTDLSWGVSLVHNVIKSNNNYSQFSSDLEKIYKKIISKSEGYEYSITPTESYFFITLRISIEVAKKLRKENAELKYNNQLILKQIKKESHYMDLGAGLIIL